MRHTISFIILLVQLPLFLVAQTEKKAIAFTHDPIATQQEDKPVGCLEHTDNNIAQQIEENKDVNMDFHDSCFHYRSMVPVDYDYFMHPWYSYRSMGWFSVSPYWTLHDGINVTLGASVFGEFGKGAHRGVGFSEQVALAYAHHFALKSGDVIYGDGGRKGFTLVGGAYFNNVDYAHANYKDAGFYGELSYRFDEHWEAAIYGQKSFMDKNRMIPPSLYDMEQLGDRIGASVRYNFSPSFSMQLSVESSSRPEPPIPSSPFESERMK